MTLLLIDTSQIITINKSDLLEKNGYKKDLAMKQCRLILKQIWHKVLFILFTAFIITGLSSLIVTLSK
ncbi:MAG: hypothetical protein A2Y48_01785 [Nitrospirae bacterium RIFCSPLOW2_12_42_9]|nr:MAG: hypothetical protein A2Z60_00215 [Nitrospirae bacterium RIFCSPLOWO2_02_42_7]OGW62481.1 MAG: hypothetical protein A2Y48_01785 [Nitrospirae bacterium RIFCSPLOW2_12_42_9]